MSNTLSTAASLRERPAGMDGVQHLQAARAAASSHLKAMQDVADGAAVEDRKLLASEQREVDKHDDEVRRLGIIIRRLEESDPDCTYVDRSQIVGQTPPTTTREDTGPLLTREQSFAGWAKRAGVDRGQAEDVRLGSLLRSWVTGQRGHLNESEQRAMAEGTSTAGGHLVPSPLAGEVIDAARNRARVMQAGAVTVPMTANTLKVPRLVGTSSPAWRQENAAVAEGDLTLDAVELQAKSMAFLVKMSRELFEDSDPSADELVRNDFAAQIALEFDRVALRGTGTDPEPEGVLNQTGVTTTTHGTDGAVIGTGASEVNWDALVDAQGAVRGENFEPNASIWAPRTASAFGKLKDSQGQYLNPPSVLDGLTRYATNQVPTDLTTGTNSDTSEIYTGQWNQLYMGIRTGPLILQLVERYADVGQVALLVWMRGDIALAHGAAFHVDTGVRG